MLHPAAAAAAASSSWPRLLLPVPLPRRSSTTKEHPHRVQRMDQFWWKLSLSGMPIVISGYWTGPDVDDGCGSVEAVLQRIV
ncbi:hypothetical protein EJB05_10608, partial [Eragrostis curvula]